MSGCFISILCASLELIFISNFIHCHINWFSNAMYGKHQFPTNKPCSTLAIMTGAGVARWLVEPMIQTIGSIICLWMSLQSSEKLTLWRSETWPPQGHQVEKFCQDFVFIHQTRLCYRYDDCPRSTEKLSSKHFNSQHRYRSSLPSLARAKTFVTIYWTNK